MNDSIINSASHLKYLGVIIDSKLNWIPHITHIKTKISKGIGNMFKPSDYLKKNVCQTCTIPIYFHISFTALKCGVMRPIVTTSLVFTPGKNYSVTHILETFSSYRTYIQIIKYSFTQQSIITEFDF